MSDDILTPREPSKGDLEMALRLLTESSARRIAELEREARESAGRLAEVAPPSATRERESEYLRKPETSPRDVMKCTGCRRRLDVARAVIVWNFDVPYVGSTRVSRLEILCRDGCVAESGGWYSCDLRSFADREYALWRLAGFMVDYQWPAAHMETLIMLAWAAPIVATDEQRKRAKCEFKERMAGGW